MANQSPYAKPARMLYAVVTSETIAEISTVPTVRFNCKSPAYLQSNTAHLKRKGAQFTLLYDM